MLKNNKKIILGVIAIIILFFGYWYFFLSKKSNTTTTDNAVVATNSVQSTAPGVSTNAYDKEFVANLQTVRYIDLNAEIFTKPAYKALTFPEVPFAVDYNIPVGRRNPFLPLGVDVTQNSNATVEIQPTSSTTTLPTAVRATTTRATTTQRTTR